MPDDPPKLAANASILARVRVGIRCLDVLTNDPANPIYGPLLTAALDRESFARIAGAWRGRSDASRVLDERPTLQGPDLDLEALARMPEGTLGAEFARYFRDNGIAPFVSPFPIDDDADYLCKRYRETHDLFHVITGYGTDELGEMELQAFVVGNLGIRHPMLVLAYSIQRWIHLRGVRGLGGYLRTLRAAYDRGRRSRELLDVRYETLWAQPVASLSELLCASA